METQRPASMSGDLPLFSPPSVRPRSFDDFKGDAMHIENTQRRTERAVSVISGMSAEDMEAAETLKSLGKDIHSPRLQQGPIVSPTVGSTYNSHEPEPLLSLITSQYPLAASVISGSISVYKSAQHFTPGGKWTEENVGLPLARNAARLTGVESAARWALTNPKKAHGQRPSFSDVEKGYLELTPSGVPSRETLPAYNAGDRSPPYSEQQVVLSRDQPPSGWQQRLVITTSGLGVAMSEESIRSLKYCLNWLRWANSHLGGAVSELGRLLQQWERRPSSESQPMSVASMTESPEESALIAKIAELKAEVLKTLKQVVNVVSTYAGSALPSNARDFVHQHLTSLPRRFSVASSRTGQQKPRDEASQNANRALLLAQEGLDMMNQVSRVVNDTLVSAEDWLEELRRRRLSIVQSPTQIDPALMADRKASGDRQSSDQTDRQGDHKMEM